MDNKEFKVGDTIKVGLSECIILKECAIKGYWIVEEINSENIFTAHEISMSKII